MALTCCLEKAYSGEGRVLLGGRRAGTIPFPLHSPMHIPILLISLFTYLPSGRGSYFPFCCFSCLYVLRSMTGLSLISLLFFTVYYAPAYLIHHAETCILPSPFNVDSMPWLT